MFGSRVPFPLLSAGQRVTSPSPEAQLPRARHAPAPPGSASCRLSRRGDRGGAVQGAGRAARRPGKPAAPGQRLCPLFQRTTRGAEWLTGAPGRSGSRYAVSPPVSRRTAAHTPTLGDAPCLRRRTAAPLRGPGPGADTGHRPPCALPPVPSPALALLWPRPRPPREGRPRAPPPLLR